MIKRKNIAEKVKSCWIIQETQDKLFESPGLKQFFLKVKEALVILVLTLI